MFHEKYIMRSHIDGDVRSDQIRESMVHYFFISYVNVFEFGLKRERENYD